MVEPCGAVVAEGRSETGTLAESTQLHDGSEEMETIDFLPKIETGFPPEMGDVLQVCFDGGIGRESSIIQILKRIHATTSRVPELRVRGVIGTKVLHQSDGSEGRSVSLRSAPILCVWCAIDHELGLTETGEVFETARWIVRVLNFVGKASIGFEDGYDFGRDVGGRVFAVQVD